MSGINLGVYVIQVVLVVAAATLAASLLRLAVPRARLTYWRAVVVACLVLPLLPVRHIDVVAPIEPAITATAVTATAIVAPIASPARRSIPARRILELLPWLLLFGAGGRAMWLGAGLFRLSRLRRRGQPALLDDEVLVLQRALAPHAEMRWHERLAQPVTFGFRRPVVLLPSRLGSLPLDIQRAVVCHELLHVGRRDWLWTLAEEAVRTLFWFHPGMRWALAQVQLSREETVDTLVVAITGARRAYMNALMLFAPGSPGIADLAPAPATLFIRRRQLVVRMKAISQEVRMSPMRLASTGTALVAVLMGSSWAVVSAMPLHASVSTRALAARPLTVSATAPERTGSVLSSPDAVQNPPADAESRKALDQAERQLIEQAKRLQAAEAAQAATKAGRRVSKEVKAIYPANLMYLGLDVEVTLSVTISPAGDVTNEEAASWSMRTTKGDTAKTTEAATTAAAQPFVEAAKAAARQWKFTPAESASVVELLFTFKMKSNSEAGRGEGVGSGTGVGVGVGDVSGSVAGSVIGGVIGDVPGGVVGGMPGGVGGGIPGGVGGGVPGAATARPGELPPPPVARIGGKMAVRVGGNIRQPRKIFDVRPVYPEDAKAQKVQGVVIIETRIATDGSIADARVLRSIPMLDQAAIDAVRQWQFEPTHLNGEPVEVIMTVTVNFTIQ